MGKNSAEPCTRRKAGNKGRQQGNGVGILDGRRDAQIGKATRGRVDTCRHERTLHDAPGVARLARYSKVSLQANLLGLQGGPRQRNLHTCRDRAVQMFQQMHRYNGRESEIYQQDTGQLRRATDTGSQRGQSRVGHDASPERIGAGEGIHAKISNESLG